MPTNDSRGLIKLPADQVRQAGDTYFLGIGINAYQHWTPLRNAAGDIKAIINLLQADYGLENSKVTLLLDQTASEDAIISELERLAATLTAQDSLLIYYAGHGHLDEYGNGFWIPADGPLDKKNRWIRNSTLISDYIAKINSLHTLLISDSCYSGSLFTTLRNGSRGRAEELMRLRSRWAICSGRSDQAVSDGKVGARSPFAQAILDVLGKTQQPYITAGWLLEQVSEQTRTNYEQLPDGGALNGVGHERGQYVFRRTTATATSPSAETQKVESTAPTLSPTPTPSVPLRSSTELAGIERAIELKTKIINQLREALALEDDPIRQIRYQAQLEQAERDLTDLHEKLS